MRSANLQVCDKNSTLKAAENHLTHVQLERSYYRTTCNNCRQQVWACFTETVPSHHHCLTTKFLQIPTEWKCTTLSITHITHVILCGLANRFFDTSKVLNRWCSLQSYPPSGELPWRRGWRLWQGRKYSHQSAALLLWASRPRGDGGVPACWQLYGSK